MHRLLTMNMFLQATCHIFGVVGTWEFISARENSTLPSKGWLWMVYHPLDGAEWRSAKPSPLSNGIWNCCLKDRWSSLQLVLVVEVHALFRRFKTFLSSCDALYSLHIWWLIAISFELQLQNQLLHYDCCNSRWVIKIYIFFSFLFWNWKSMALLFIVSIYWLGFCCFVSTTALGFLRRPLAIVAALLTALSIAILNDRLVYHSK